MLMLLAYHITIDTQKERTHKHEFPPPYASEPLDGVETIKNALYVNGVLDIAITILTWLASYCTVVQSHMVNQVTNKLLEKKIVENSNEQDSIQDHCFYH
ncbi:uncharacterized protein LOC108223771 isoform X3 [Daucus carota subsp. sativus]|uniref:uncharacterized protein LOC108223771 isoform X3 n=1 Tax=Daucus carota subsp. sativus TaxID=79200 RepID=UPI0030835CDE